MPATPSETGPGGPAAAAAETRDEPPGGVGDAMPRPSTPTLVLRPRWICWLPLPVLLAAAVLLVARGRSFGIALVPLALVFLPVLWVQIEASESTVRCRDWRRRWRRVPLESITAMRLRRLPYRVLRRVRRGYRVGRFWSVPLTLRLLEESSVRLELRCAWWGGWRELARFAATLPEIDIDSRSRARLDRYVGPIARDTPVQP